ncbi:unnamed protein product [Durusdinium trenchii]|uniref:Uncharacterized protein n=1 Tax=Durusdinium trenchii TaxID=1381693 RepID=A0ABP0HGT3_9DINO
MGSNQSECCGVKRAEPFDCCGPKRAQPVVSHPGAGAAACFLEAEPDERGSPLSVEPSEPPSPARTDRKGNPILPRELTPSGLTPHHISFADDEGGPVEEVVEVLVSQPSATDRLANSWKALQSSFCRKAKDGVK